MSGEYPTEPLLKVCDLLNRHGVHYLVAGAHACILHGLVRTTEDVDLLVEDDDGNFRKLIDALSQLHDHAAAELTVDDLRDNTVIKVADEVEVDISKQAWKVSYADAHSRVETTTIDGVTIPYMGLQDLIRSKETYREKDKADLQLLKRIAAQHKPADD